MTINIHESWKRNLSNEFDKPYFPALISFVNIEYGQHTCYPNNSSIFAAFDHCPYHATKVVIIGQDPYHGPGQANGLSFSVNDEIPHPPSLANIFKEIETDLGKHYPKSGNLEHWAKQGVLLLNATLTVRAHQAGSHQKKGWETFTDAIIKNLSNEKEGLVFMLWGGFAKNKITLIDDSKHYVLKSGHPSPLSANRGLWFGNKHFSRCNELLYNTGKEKIHW